MPMAVGVLRAGERVVFDDTGCPFLGELGLAGALRHTNGILPMVTLARDHGMTTVFVPAIDAHEAALVEGMTIIPVENLAPAGARPAGDVPIAPDRRLELSEAVEPVAATDFATVLDQWQVTPGLEVAAAGGHNVLML
jgi:magnesium chelatase family protein